jgi:hypothetical protein
MMSNVVSLFGDDLKHCSYYEKNDDIGVAMLDSSIIIVPLNAKEFEVTIKDTSTLFSRAELAEFLHVASVLVDSEQRHLPKIELVGRNYKD